MLIFLEHINALFSISTMSKGDSVSFRNIIDNVSAIRGSLLSLGSELDILNGVCELSEMRILVVTNSNISSELTLICSSLCVYLSSTC